MRIYLESQHNKQQFRKKDLAVGSWLDLYFPITAYDIIVKKKRYET